jgi:hypothetical protein
MNPELPKTLVAGADKAKKLSASLDQLIIDATDLKAQLAAGADALTEAHQAVLAHSPEVLTKPIAPVAPSKPTVAHDTPASKPVPHDTPAPTHQAPPPPKKNGH